MDPEEHASKKRREEITKTDPFSLGTVTATGERIFVPIRTKATTEEQEKAEVKPYTDLRAITVLSPDETKLIRLQNRIQVEGDDIVGPILQFRNIGLHDVFLRRLSLRKISVKSKHKIKTVDSKTCSNARNSPYHDRKRYCYSF